jgi:hypothetical protein
MALGDEFLGEIGDDALRSSIKPWRDAFHQGRDLGDLHEKPFCGESGIASVGKEAGTCEGQFVNAAAMQ